MVSLASCRIFSFEGLPMRRQYLHLSTYHCDACDGPVVAGSLAVREDEISKETDIRQVGAVCLSCGQRQYGASARARAHQLLPLEWAATGTIKVSSLTTVSGKALNRAELTETA